MMMLVVVLRHRLCHGPAGGLVLLVVRSPQPGSLSGLYGVGKVLEDLNFVGGRRGGVDGLSARLECFGGGLEEVKGRCP